MNYFDVLFGMKIEAKKHPAVIKKRTGNPIELTDGADAPMVKCVTAITGSQDLHGQDKPWVGGAGKNKLVAPTLAELQTLNTSGTWNNSTYTINGITFVCHSGADGLLTYIEEYGNSTGQAVLNLKPFSGLNGDYIFSGGISGEKNITYKKNGTWSGIYATGADVNVSFLTSDTVQPAISISNNQSGSGSFYPMFRLSTVTDSTFAPYSNICPITAYDESTISVGGRNLCNQADKTTSGSGYVIGTNAPDYINTAHTVFPAGKYTFSFNVSGAKSGSQAQVIFYKDDSHSVGGKTGAVGTAGRKPYTITATEPFAKIQLYCNSSSGGQFTDFQLERGDTPHDYEPYTSTIHTTTYPSAIYRGSEDVVNGSVNATWGVADLGDLTWSPSGSGGRFYARFSVDDNVKPSPSSSVKGNYICENYNAGSQSDIADRGIDGTVSLDSSVPPFINILDTSCAGMTGADFKTHVTGVKFAYELATSTTSSVTPTNLPIKSLSGYNHIESSTGEMEIDYITEGYQHFVDTVESALPNTRKGGTKAMDIFLSLDLERKPESEPEPKKEEKTEEPEKEVKK